MSLKYVAAYLMVSLTGQESPSAMDVKNVLNSVGAEVDETILNKLISVMEGKVIHETISAGMSKLQSVPAGGTVASASDAAPVAGGNVSAPVEETKVEEEPEEEDDLGFSLFD